MAVKSLPLFHCSIIIKSIFDIKWKHCVTKEFFNLIHANRNPLCKSVIIQLLFPYTTYIYNYGNFFFFKRRNIILSQHFVSNSALNEKSRFERHEKNVPPQEKLTDHIQIHDMTHVRRRGYLTLVITAVPKLRIFDFECPVVRLCIVDRPESLVVRVRVTTDGEQMNVPVPDPGNLQRHL